MKLFLINVILVSGFMLYINSRLSQIDKNFVKVINQNIFLGDKLMECRSSK